MSAPTASAKEPRLWGMPLSGLNQRRLANFRHNRRGFWSNRLFWVLFLLSLPAEFIANDRPLLVQFDGSYYVPVVATYPETVFGGDFETEAEYRDPFVRELIEAKGWILWPPIRYSYDTVNYDLKHPAPAPPDSDNLLGTDDQARDVVARVLYGHVFRNAMLIVIAGFPGAFVDIFFTGALLTEIIFSLDGLGLLGYEAAIGRDYPVMFATLYFFTLLGLLMQLIGDLTYTLVDRRIDFESREV